jgi:hypothetical protein
MAHTPAADPCLAVVEDGCGDWDPEVHPTLVEKVFPTRAMVTTAESVVRALCRAWSTRLLGASDHDASPGRARQRLTGP